MKGKTKELPVTDAEQKTLHKSLVEKMSFLFSQNIGEMTKVTALNVAIDFCVASIVFVFKSTNTLSKLEGKIIGDEVARRIDEIKKL